MATPEAPEESHFPIPRGIQEPLPGLPPVERVDPLTEPVSQRVIKPGSTQPELPKLFEVKEIPKPKAHIPDPNRQLLHKRLGGSTSHPEGQATIERRPVNSITNEDEVFGAEQARAFLKSREKPTEQIRGE